jgi:hypothetical protein
MPRSTLLFISVCLTCSAGCDPVYKTEQLVLAQVTDCDAGAPLTYASLEPLLKYHKRFRPDLPTAERQAAYFEERSEVPYYKVDDAGYAAFPLYTTTVCGGFFPGTIPGFDPSVDRITGTSYLFRINDADRTEIVEVLIEPGRDSAGEAFEVHILAVGESKLAKWD